MTFAIPPAESGFRVLLILSRTHLYRLERVLLLLWWLSRDRSYDTQTSLSEPLPLPLLLPTRSHTHTSSVSFALHRFLLSSPRFVISLFYTITVGIRPSLGSALLRGKPSDPLLSLISAFHIINQDALPALCPIFPPSQQAPRALGPLGLTQPTQRLIRSTA